MKVLHINSHDIVGGASIAAYRLHRGLLEKSVPSEILARTVYSMEKEINKLTHKKLIDGVLAQAGYYAGLQNIFSLRTFGIAKMDCFRRADVINLHNLHPGYFNYLGLPLLTKNKPAVYTLHDMWAFTGHCAHSFDCERWKSGCGKCKYPDSYPPIFIDNAKLSLRLKSRSYQKSNLGIVTPSRWLERLARESILKDLPVYYVPNGVDLQVFRPVDRSACRNILGIPGDSTVLMYVAENPDNPYKEAKSLIEAIRILPNDIKRRLHLLSMGRHSDPSIKEEFSTTDLGYIESDHLKTIAYNCADVFLLMSNAENLPLVLQESMACGTPMVAFDVGGVPELVRPGLTGYLVKHGDIDGFSKGVMELIVEKDLIERMRRSCREIAEKEYGLGLQVERYLGVYQELLENVNRKGAN